MLPKLPVLPEKVKPRPHFAYVVMEPIVPKYTKEAFALLTPSLKEKAVKEAEQDAYEKSMKRGNMRRAIVMALPNDLDTKKFTMQVGDVVGVPYGNFDMINVDKTLVHMVGVYDLAVLPDLTEEEVKEWDTNMERYRTEVMYPVKEDSKIIKLR